jgi:hypothetical protein
MTMCMTTRGMGMSTRIIIEGPTAVMAGLVPAIHAFGCFISAKTWMPGTRPGMTN